VNGLPVDRALLGLAILFSLAVYALVLVKACQ